MKRRTPLLILFTVLLTLSAASVLADTCGGHGQPPCPDTGCGTYQGSPLQECGDDGLCWSCCGDGTTNDVCGEYPGVGSCDGNPLSVFYDADCDACGTFEEPWCNDPDYACDAGLYPLEEDSYTDPSPSDWQLCCDDTDDCVHVNDCIDAGTINLFYWSESSICSDNQIIACTGYHDPDYLERSVGTTLEGACCQGPYTDQWLGSNEWKQEPAGEDTWSLQESCADGADNDCDGLIDCADDDCAGVNGCPSSGCADDPDGADCQATCESSGYNWTANGGQLNCCGDDTLEDDPYQDTETYCDGHDNDCDGQTDESYPTLGNFCAIGVGVCRNTGSIICDNDLIGTHCSATEGSPSETPETTCTGGLDEDCDGVTDCADSDCADDPACQQQSCEDNDGDGYDGYDPETCTTGTDCDDTNPNVNPGEDEICDNGIDDDCDGLIDSDDPDCSNSCVPYNELYDYNDNNLMSIGDVNILLDVIAGTLECPPAKICDINGDGQLSQADAQRLSALIQGATDGEQCTDGIDNDCDTKTDGEDEDCWECDTDDDCDSIWCASLNDTIEGHCSVNHICVYITPPDNCYSNCSNDRDDDGDGLIDFDGNNGTTLPDPGCDSFADNDETNGCINDSDCIDVCPDGTNSSGWPWQGSCVSGECKYDDEDCNTCHSYYHLMDYNNDGRLDNGDVSRLYFVIPPYNEPCPTGYLCDIDGSGSVTIDDVFLLQDIINGTSSYGEFDPFCDDLLDNDCDGLIDDEDPDCSTTPTCSDTDAGIDPAVQGTVTIINGTPVSVPYTDYCIDDNTLNEYYCNGLSPDSEIISCAGGCFNGACNRISEPICGQGLVHLDAEGAEDAVNIYHVDETTGIATFHNSYDGGEYRSAVAIDDNGIVYSLRYRSGQDYLVTLNGDGSVTEIGPTAQGGPALAFATDGNLYLFGPPNTLYHINTVTGATLPLRSYNDMAVSGGDLIRASDGGLYYLKLNGDLYHIDFPSYDATLVGNLPGGQSFTSGATSEIGQYFAYGRENDRLYTFEVSPFDYTLLADDAGPFSYGDGASCPGSAPPLFCGDGVIEAGETCDEGGSLDISFNPPEHTEMRKESETSYQGDLSEAGIDWQFDMDPIAEVLTIVIDSSNTQHVVMTTTDDRHWTGALTYDGESYFIQFTREVWGPITSCENFDDFTSGTLTCGNDCLFNTTMCEGEPNPFCGDGVIQEGETCDGNPGDPIWDWGPITNCSDFDDFTDQGNLSCDMTTCHFDTSECTTEQPLCEDSDGGYNPYVFGTATQGNYGSFDYCDFFTSYYGTLHEAVCQNGPTHQVGPCPNDAPYCRNGICIDQNTTICSDTDGGIVPETQGTVTVSTTTPPPQHTDYCQLGDNTPVPNCTGTDCYVREFYCQGYGSLGYQNIRCDECVDGECIETPPLACGDGIISPGEQCDFNTLGQIERLFLPEGNSTIVNLWNIPHNITVVYVSDPFTVPPTARFDVNGEVTPYLEEGDSYQFQTSATLRVSDIYTNLRDGWVRFDIFMDQPLFANLICEDFDNFTGGDLFCMPDCQINVSMCEGGTPGDCGDGHVNIGEQCDLTNFSGLGCTDFDNFTTGDLSCLPNCQINTSDCSVGNCTDDDGDGYSPDGGICGAIDCNDTDPNVHPGAVEICTGLTDENCNGLVDCADPDCFADPLCTSATCGDGYLDPSEQCEFLYGFPVYYGLSCQNFDNFTGGNLSCDPVTCLVNVSMCTGGTNGTCGDGSVNIGEQCDGTNFSGLTCQNFDNFQGGNLLCTAQCAVDTSGCTQDPAICGNSIIEGLEECDDGNLINGDGCSAICTNESGGYCGDGIYTPGEQCEFINGTMDFGNLNCTDFDNFTSGNLLCSPFDCTIDTGQCQGGNPGICGDGVVNTGEQCDGSDWGGIANCTQFDNFTGGTLTCDQSVCLFDTSQCTGGTSICGDGIIQVGEQCDGTNWGPITNCTNFDNYTGGTLSCDPVTCVFNVSQCTGGNTSGFCGDDVINNFEQCDGNPGDPAYDWGPIVNCSDFDSFTAGTLSCDGQCLFNTSLCQIPPGPYCGDGIIQPGEQCEAGPNWGPITGCSDFDNFTGGTLDCDLSTCLFNTTQCTQPAPYCGDGLIQPGEQCDFDALGGEIWGNLDCTDFDNFTGGSLSCIPSTCQANITQCTGGTNGTCGDGVVNQGEQCDYVSPSVWVFDNLTCSDFDTFTGGNLICQPGCTVDTSQCTAPAPFCGDSYIQSGEQCEGNPGDPSFNWGNITDCTDFDSFQSGTLTCNPGDCLFNTSQCSFNPPQPSCGNGVIETGETCDGSNLGGLTCANYGYNRGSLSCTNQCTINKGGCSNGGGGHHGGGGGGGGGGSGCATGYHLEDSECVPDTTPVTPTVCDQDGDGYVRYHPSCIGQGLGTDCNDRDKNIHPGAKEVCGNGVDDNCDGEIDEGCIVESPLSFNSQIRVPILSIFAYDVTVVNLGTYDLQDAELALDLPSNWEYPGVRKLGTLSVGEAKRVTFPILVSEDLETTQQFTIELRDQSGVVESGEVNVKVEIPVFAVRIKPSLDNYADTEDAEVFVLLNNKEGKSLRDLEVEMDVNEGQRTDYVQYLGVFGLKPYAKFRYRYTYPVENLAPNGIIVEGVLRQDGTEVATSDDTIDTVYHPTRFDKDGRTGEQIIFD